MMGLNELAEFIGHGLVIKRIMLFDNWCKGINAEEIVLPGANYCMSTHLYYIIGTKLLLLEIWFKY